MGWINGLLQRFVPGARARNAALVSEDAFTELVAERIRERLPMRNVVIAGPLALRVDSSNADAAGDGQSMYLDNAWLQYRAGDVSSRDDILETYLASLVATFETVALTVEQIVPIVKDVAWFDTVRALSVDAGEVYDGAYDVLNEDLVVLYAQNTPANLRYIHDSDLAAIDVSRDGLRRRAVGNLRALLAGIEVHRGPVSMVTVGGDFESSLLLFDDLWVREGARMRGAPVVAVPTRELLLFADAADIDAVATLQAMAKDAMVDAAYALTDQLFVLAPDGWRRHLPPAAGVVALDA